MRAISSDLHPAQFTTWRARNVTVVPAPAMVVPLDGLKAKGLPLPRAFPRVSACAAQAPTRSATAARAAPSHPATFVTAGTAAASPARRARRARTSGRIHDDPPAAVAGTWTAVTSSASPSRRSPVTQCRSRRSTPFATAFSATAMQNSYGTMVPASPAKSAAVQSALMCGSMRRSSSCPMMRRLRTPLVFPCSSSFSSIFSSSGPLATTSDPLRWKPKWSSSSSCGNMRHPVGQNCARREPGLSSKPACTMPELPFVAPCDTSSAPSSHSTDAWVLASSRATVAPTHPAPMMATS
mmetsp:Transcript_9460/g.29272  ORF Transcript_9460/g.29272 Transcript_9460/m.29272 type:complete len:296 (+) Transcript_9460:1059-1946(+)